MIEILLVDDHEVVGEGTKNLLEKEPDVNVDFVVCSNQVEKLVKEKKYDMYLFDLSMPNKNGIELTAELLTIHPDAKVLIFTGLDLSVHFNYLVDIGVSGFISKGSSSQQLIKVIKLAMEGQVVIPIDLLHQLRRTENEVLLDDGRKVSLSQTEEDILVNVSKGKTNDEIARDIYMSRRNVERHLTGIFKKLNVSSRAEAIMKGRDLGLLPEVMI